MKTTGLAYPQVVNVDKASATATCFGFLGMLTQVGIGCHYNFI